MNPDHVSSRFDTTRPGPARTVWEARFPWEGSRLLAQIDGLPVAESPLTIHAYVSESQEVRGLLKGSIAQRLRERKQMAVVRVRSAYKTGYFWLLEEVQPLWRRHQADRLTVTYPVIPPADEGRFLQELYPLAAVLEREGLSLEFVPAGAEPQYQAVIWRGGEELWRGTCALPVHQRTALDGRAVLAPTGGLTVWDGTSVLHDGRLRTDGELFWDWYGETVMPHLLALADGRPDLPTFKNLSVNLHLSEPDLAIGVLDERISMTEALTEDIYFGTLDALKARAGTPVGDRSLMPGRIVPVAISTPGQDGWVSVTLTTWGETAFPVEFTAETAPPVPEWSGTPPGFSGSQPWKPARLWAAARQQAKHHGLEWHVPAYSVDGRPVPAVLRPPLDGQALMGGVLVTGGQHANETTGAAAALQLIEPLARGPLPFAVLPIENPDGAHLHRVLSQLNPEHMHHAARYTSLGDDLEVRLKTGQAHWEARARAWAAQQVNAKLHINLHGYPAHEWVRPYSGYAPLGFESWAVPTGFLTIVWYHPEYLQRARELAEAIARRLTLLTDVAEHAAQACRAGAAHVGTPHYELIQGLPFLVAERAGALCPLTVITEAPDETIYGQRFEMFVRAHVAVGEAALDYHIRTTGETS